MGKIYPVLPKDELDRFAAEVLTEEALAELLSDPERYVFAYVADIERSGRSGKFQSFNMYESANVIRATYGKLDVTIEFKEDRNGMQKLVTYADERLLSRYAQCDPTRWRKGEVDNSLSQYLSIDELWSRTKRNYQRNVAVVKPALSLDLSLIHI